MEPKWTGGVKLLAGGTGMATKQFQRYQSEFNHWIVCKIKFRRGTGQFQGITNKLAGT